MISQFGYWYHDSVAALISIGSLFASQVDVGSHCSQTSRPLGDFRFHCF